MGMLVHHKGKAIVGDTKTTQNNKPKNREMVSHYAWKRRLAYRIDDL